MDKKKFEFVIAGAALAIFVLLIANNIKKPRPKEPPIKQELTSAASQPQRSDALFWIKKENSKGGLVESRELKWGRDPFTLQEAVQAVDTIANLRLMGITIGDKARPRAIINDRIVSVGSRIGKFKVLEISSDRVIVTDGEENFELQMK